MGTVKSLGMNIWNRICSLLPGFDPNRFHTVTARFILYLVLFLAFLILIIRQYKLSTGIRKLKEENWRHKADKEKARVLKRSFRRRVILSLLLLGAAGALLAYFSYPGIPALEGSGKDAYEAIAGSIRLEKVFRRTLGFFAPFIVWAALWAVTRRIVNKAARTCFTVFFVLSCVSLIPAIGSLIMAAVNPSSFTITGKEMLARANSDYRAGLYDSAGTVYEGLILRQDGTAASREDLLNNLALVQLQKGENEEALETMRQVFRESGAEPYHVINLLVAAHCNGISSADILAETGADGFVQQSSLTSGNMKDYVRLRNAVVYNIAYMDMELDDRILQEGTPVGNLFPGTGRAAAAEAVVNTDVQASGNVEEAYNALKAALSKMQEENQLAYSGTDSDITELAAYLDARMAGGAPVLAGE